MQKVPVLFIVFNRPLKAEQVLQKISEYKPDSLYISIDSPRSNNINDIEKCKLVQDVIKEGVNWPCKIMTLSYDENQGCKRAVSQALNWFFEHEPYGVILEEDCVPDLSFFDYACELLRKYVHDERIFSISGYNFGYTINTGDSYLFSRYMNMWGWASWRRVAVQVDYELLEWDSLSRFSKRLFLAKCLSLQEKDFDWGWILYWEDLLNQIPSGRMNTWDFQWFYVQFRTSALTIFPSVNLIYNIGFDAEATFTSEKTYLTHVAEEIPLPLVHPQKITADSRFVKEIIKDVWALYERQSIAWHLRTTKFYKSFRTFKLFKSLRFILKGR